MNNDVSLIESLDNAAHIAIAKVLKLSAGEQVLIISNPGGETETIARKLYDAALGCSAAPVLLLQPVKTQLDFAEPAVIAALKTRPQAVISITTKRLGKDCEGITNPYKFGEEEFDHIFHFLLHGEKSCRSFWSPGTSLESFSRTVPIDYPVLASNCDTVSKILSEAESVHVTAPAGTDITIGLRGRTAKSDDGNFSMPGKGGNLPAGESFISPENGTANGIIVYDGSISLYKGDIIIQKPIHCRFRNGFVTDISGGAEAEALKETISRAENNALDYEKDGRLPPGKGAVYAKNAGNLGELGIGLNPAARITGVMLEDEKAIRTCHFAIGQNYDNDAPALIHLDGLVKKPTITAFMADGSSIVIEQDGELLCS